MITNFNTLVQIILRFNIKKKKKLINPLEVRNALIRYFLEICE